MRKLLKAIGVLALLAGLWLGLVLSEWLPPQTEAQRAARALLDQVPANAQGERNAFAAMWLFGYDVPDADLEKVAAADAAAFAEAAARTGNVTDFKSSAEGRYPAVPAPQSSDPLLCASWGGPCLERVRSDPEATRARLGEFAKRLDRADRLASYDHYRYGFIPRFDSPIGGGTGFTLQITAAALEYVDGRRDAAFARLCRDTAAWRRLRARSDALILDMLGVAMMSSASQLYAEMLAGEAVDFAPPCAETFAPLSDAEADQCASLRGEYLFSRNSFIDAVRTNAFADKPRPRWFTESLARLINERHVVDLTASHFAPICGEANRARVQRRDPDPLPSEVACSAMDWGFDPVGCAMFFESPPSYNDYYVRVLDLDARLRLLNTALWMRSAPSGDRATQFEARPAALQAPRHAFVLDQEKNTLRMTNLERSGPRGELWEIPLGGQVAPASTGPTPPAADETDG